MCWHVSVCRIFTKLVLKYFSYQVKDLSYVSMHRCIGKNFGWPKGKTMTYHRVSCRDVEDCGDTPRSLKTSQNSLHNDVAVLVR